MTTPPSYPPSASPAQPSFPGGPVPLWAPLYGASIGDAARRFFKKYATFSGRASRSEYWWWVLIQTVISLVFQILLSIAGAGSMRADGTVSSPSALYIIVAIVFGLWGLATIIPTLALLSRRLHDANFSAGFIFLLLIPFLGGLAVLIMTILPSKPEGARFDRPTA